MMSRSYTNLQDLAAGNFPAMGGAGFARRRMPRVASVPSTLAELDDEDHPNSVSSDVPSSLAQDDRIIIVANQLPVRAKRRPDGQGWLFSFDDDSLLLQLKDGLPDDMEVLYVGSLRVEIDAKEQEEVSQTLLERFNCVPAFLPPDLHDRFYQLFCKQLLWPLLHYMLPYHGPGGTGIGCFDRSLWEAYVLANKLFSQRVIEVLNPEDDYVWIHDYHLMALPTFLRRRFNRLRMGFFLHSPFPSSEIYRTLPVRNEILQALLNCDLIGFHTFDYARHFLSCCSRMLGLDYQSKRGYIGLEYFGRTVGIKIMPVGVHMGRLRASLALPETDQRVAELRGQLGAGRTVLLGVDDMDIFKGINLKLMAFEHMLRLYPNWRGNAVLVQIANPARGRGRDLEETQTEIQETCRRINEEFGSQDYKPVVFVERPVSVAERIAYYIVAECVVVTPVRDGMNLTPYEYIVSRQGAGGSDANSKKRSMLVVSEFIGCSPSLSGALRVNPWNIEATAEAMNEAISQNEADKELRHEKHYRYVSTHDMAYWSRSFLQDMERTCKDHFRRRCWGFGLGFGFRVVALDPNFRKLNMDSIVMAYEKAKSRAILLDYDGTVMPQTSINKAPSNRVISIINTLCADKANVVFIVSGRGRQNLEQWFSPCQKLGLAAEHGYFVRRSTDDEWETCGQTSDFGWMRMAEPVMNLYAEATDGSILEMKESALVWHHQDADPGFGSAQAKELLDHLESVLANEPVLVKSGQFIVEVKPQGVTKGLVVEKILSSMVESGRRADFVLCIGDDRSDEDMFEGLSGIMTRDIVSPNTSVFACTVGQKPSKAKYYLDDTTEVMNMLHSLAEASAPAPSSPDAIAETSS